MTSVTIERELPIPADEVWTRIGGFGAVERWSSEFGVRGASETEAKTGIAEFLRAGLDNLR